jgi:hypothetical protein
MTLTAKVAMFVIVHENASSGVGLFKSAGGDAGMSANTCVSTCHDVLCLMLHVLL